MKFLTISFKLDTSGMYVIGEITVHNEDRERPEILPARKGCMYALSYALAEAFCIMRDLCKERNFEVIDRNTTTLGNNWLVVSYTLDEPRTSDLDRR